MSAKQELQQKVLHKYGWSARFDKDPVSTLSSANNNNKNTVNDTTTGEKKLPHAGKTRQNQKNKLQQESTTTTMVLWSCYIRMGFVLEEERRFDAPEAVMDTEKGRKQGMNAACQVALQGLKPAIQQEEAKRLVELTEAYSYLHNNDREEDDANNRNDDETNGANQKQPPFLIKGATPQNWNKYIWGPYQRLKQEQEQHTQATKKTTPPIIMTVGIDVEGNQTSPPVLIQIATRECVLLEIPNMNHGRRPRGGGGTNDKNKNNHDTGVGQLSQNLQRLLRDKTIAKVFCDNYSHHDKKSLGIRMPAVQQQHQQQQDVATNTKNNSTNNSKTTNLEGSFSHGSILDLEVVVNLRLGPTSVPRGLSRIVTLLLPLQSDIRIGKPSTRARPKQQGNHHHHHHRGGGRFQSIGRFALIEQGKAPPLVSLRDLTKAEQQYAAMDAWATLWAWERLSRLDSTTTTRTTSTATATSSVEMASL